MNTTRSKLIDLIEHAYPDCKYHGNTTYGFIETKYDKFHYNLSNMFIEGCNVQIDYDSDIIKEFNRILGKLSEDAQPLIKDWLIQEEISEARLAISNINGLRDRLDRNYERIVSLEESFEKLMLALSSLGQEAPYDDSKENSQ